jgi:carboxypeptidase C (cathepsin A)
MSIIKSILVVFTLVVLSNAMSLHQRTSAAMADKVTSLDGYYNFTKDFEMYSGYLTIQQQPEISIHYIFITSQRDPVKDDLTLWLNGGPGCSSLLGMILVDLFRIRARGWPQHAFLRC